MRPFRFEGEGNCQRERVMKNRLKIRRAKLADARAIIRLDQLARTDLSRVEFINRSVKAGSCHVAVSVPRIIAYAVLDYSFYGNGFISMLYVHPDHRRCGIASALMRHLGSVCRTPKLFTSTNQSNCPMQALLKKLGYARSGIIYNLDEGDPELVYWKELKP